MTLQADIKTALSAVALQAVVGTRVYPLELPAQATYPAITYRVVDSVPLSSSHDGADATTKPRVQISIWSKVALQTEQIAVLVIAAFKTHVGERNLEVIDYGRTDQEPSENAFVWLMDLRWPRRYDG